MQPARTEIEAAYPAAIEYATRRVTTDQLREVAIDAATDGIMWAIEHYSHGDDEEKPSRFENFAAAAVRKFVWHQVSNAARKERGRPGHVTLEECQHGIHERPHDLIDLPDDLRDTVVVYYLHGFTMRECDGPAGCKSQDTIRERLLRAGRILGGDAAVPMRRLREKRLEKR